MNKGRKISYSRLLISPEASHHTLASGCIEDWMQASHSACSSIGMSSPPIFADFLLSISFCLPKTQQRSTYLHPMYLAALALLQSFVARTVGHFPSASSSLSPTSTRWQYASFLGVRRYLDYCLYTEAKLMLTASKDDVRFSRAQQSLILVNCRTLRGCIWRSRCGRAADLIGRWLVFQPCLFTR